jgi:hypothetical protein
LSGVPGVGYQHHAAEDDAIHIGTMVWNPLLPDGTQNTERKTMDNATTDAWRNRRA